MELPPIVYSKHR